MASPADRALELVAQRQARRRGFNDRLMALQSPEAVMPFRCECGLIACGAAIQLSAGEYDEVRADPRRFAVLADHVLPDAERVLERRRGWVIVEKLAGPGSAVAMRAFDWAPPRSATPSRNS
jgi:hypothetical protein